MTKFITTRTDWDSQIRIGVSKSGTSWWNRNDFITTETKLILG